MSSIPLRTKLSEARRVVVKVGSSLLTREGKTGPRVDATLLRKLVAQIAELHQRGVEVTLVSSGAVAAGCAELGLTKRPTDVSELQALAAVGQRRLLSHYHTAFRKHNLSAGQILLTRTDFDDRVRYLNIRNCIARLHAMGAVPVLNENDPVAVDEIRFGDNDLLAALACHALEADALILLTSVEGLLDAQGNCVDVVEDVIASLSLARRDSSSWGSGGMRSKLEAARLVSEAGELVVIASGREPHVMTRVLDGEALGTVVSPAARRLDSKSRWIGMAARPAGSVTVDEGAASAVQARGKSLLASGVSAVTGRFDVGDVVVLRNAAGREVARGLCNYNADDLNLIKGKRSNQFQALLGRPSYKTVIHVDNLVLTSADGR